MGVRARLGSLPVVVWAIKHLVSPVDRLLVRWNLPPLSRLVVPTLLLTVTGRTSGAPRTVPLVFVRTDTGYVVANARPVGERTNPWVRNLEAAGRAEVRDHGRVLSVAVRRLADDEAAAWWPALVAVWPAFEMHYSATGERTVFVLEPVPSAAPSAR